MNELKVELKDLLSFDLLKDTLKPPFEARYSYPNASPFFEGIYDADGKHILGITVYGDTLTPAAYPAQLREFIARAITEKWERDYGTDA